MVVPLTLKSVLFQNKISNKFGIPILILLGFGGISLAYSVGTETADKYNEEYKFDSTLFSITSNQKFVQSFTFEHSHPTSMIYDDFSDWPHPWTSNQKGSLSPNGKWIMGYDGKSFVDVLQDPIDIENQVIVLEPEFVPGETRAPLVLTAEEYGDFILSVDVRTDLQLRPENPNQWEMAWIFWRYIDETHFYYFTLKPNGAESGKYDGGTNPEDQLYIADSYTPTTKVGKWSHWDIIVKGNHITILVDGKVVHDLDDYSSFDKGRIGLYNEDARTSFDNVTIKRI